jgi:hypothetical protein
MPLDASVRLLASIARPCAGNPSIVARAEALAQKVISSRPTNARTVSARILQTFERQHSELARIAPNSAAIRTSIDTLRQEIDAARDAEARSCNPSNAERCLAIRCADRDPPFEPLSEARSRALLRAAEARARQGAESLLAALAERPDREFHVAIATAPFAMTLATLPNAIQSTFAGPWRVSNTSVDSCGQRARITLAPPRRSYLNATTASLSMCFHDLSSRWFVCPSSQEEARR